MSDQNLSDNEFFTSFDPKVDLQAGKKYFDTYGFVVFRDVYTEKECHLTRDAMIKFIEKSSSNGFKMNDPHTWSKMKLIGRQTGYQFQ